MSSDKLFSATDFKQLVEDINSMRSAYTQKSHKLIWGEQREITGSDGVPAIVQLIRLEFDEPKLINVYVDSSGVALGSSTTLTAKWGCRNAEFKRDIRDGHHIFACDSLYIEGSFTAGATGQTKLFRCYAVETCEQENYNPDMLPGSVPTVPGYEYDGFTKNIHNVTMHGLDYDDNQQRPLAIDSNNSLKIIESNPVSLQISGSQVCNFDVQPAITWFPAIIGGVDFFGLYDAWFNIIFPNATDPNLTITKIFLRVFVEPTSPTVGLTEYTTLVNMSQDESLLLHGVNLVQDGMANPLPLLGVGFQIGIEGSYIGTSSTAPVEYEFYSRKIDGTF